MSYHKLCPYCLEKNRIVRKKEKSRESYSCTSCLSPIPREYAENFNTRSEVVSTVGFRGHGKSLYFSALFYSMDKLAVIWPGFYSFATDERSLDTIKDNISELKQGNLPPPTPASFPIPTNTRFSNMPAFGHRFFLFYDTGGEAFVKSGKLIKHAAFVKRSETVLFLVSLKDIDFDGTKLHDLLSTYVQGLTELGGNPKNQTLLVVLTKGDLLGSRMNDYDDLRQYLKNGGLDSLRNFKLGPYVDKMQAVSNGLGKFIHDQLKAVQFMNFAKAEFKNTEFSIISALGAKPVGNRLQVEINPKCIFDPLIWVTYNSMNWLERKKAIWRT